MRMRRTVGHCVTWAALWVLLGGCAQDDGQLSVRWGLIDQRDCTNTDIHHIQVEVAERGRTEASLVQACAEPGPGQPIDIGSVPPGFYQVRVRALSIDGVPLYSSSTPAAINPGEHIEVPIILRFVAP